MDSNVLKVDNCDTFVKKDYDINDEIDNKIHPLLPKSPFRMLITGTSGAGKSNLVLCMILKMLVYDKIYVYSKHLEQDKYKFLKQHLENMEKAMEDMDCLKIKILEQWNNTLDNLPNIETYDKEYRHLVIIDDFATCSKKDMTQITNYFVRGRHHNISVIFLTQLYFKCNRDIRLNTSYLCMFNSFNRREITSLSCELGGDLPKGMFNKIYNAILSEKYGFMYIDNTTSDIPLRYRKGFDGICRTLLDLDGIVLDDFKIEK